MKQTTPAIMTEDSNVIFGIDSEVSPEDAHSIPAEAPEQIQTADQSGTSELETTDYEVGVELEILPPVDMGKVTGIMTYLDNLPEVENTELIALTDKPLIEVFLREPISLIDALRMLPEVDRIEEITDGEGTATADATHAEGKLMKIQITLSEKSVPDKVKERLNRNVSDMLSS